MRPWLRSGSVLLSVILIFDILAVHLLPLLVGSRDNQTYKFGKYQDGFNDPLLASVAHFLISVPAFVEKHEKFFIVVATIAIAWFTFTLWRATNGLLNAAKMQQSDMKTSLEIARDAADASTKAAVAAQKSADSLLMNLRPWLCCQPEIFGPLIYNEQRDAKFQFRFHIKNLGQSPAVAIQFLPFLALNSPQHEQPIIRLQKWAEHNRAMPPRVARVLFPENKTIFGEDLGLVLFPGETHTVDYTIPITRAEIEKSCEDTMPQMIFWPSLCGIVSYSYPLASVRADTGFVYGIMLNGMPNFKLDEVAEMANMSLRNDLFGTGFVT